MLKNDLAETIALDGRWSFSLGENSPWGEVQVPGCWEAQGYSKFIEGPAFYQREVIIPESWAGHTILAEFGAVSYICSILLNGVEVGSHRGLWTSFTIDLTPATQIGGKNILELRIFKPGARFPMRSSLAGFLPDVSTTFGGIWQSVKLTALKAGLDDFWIEGDIHSHHLNVHSRAVTFNSPLANGGWKIEVFQDTELVVDQSLPFNPDGLLDTTLHIPHAELWRPENPVLYTVQVSLLEDDKPTARASQRTGFRNLSAVGSQLLFNDQPYMLRGILSWGWDPEQIAPAYSPEQVREEIHRVRALGFNLIKLCLFVPNQTFFDIADEEGMLLWQEMPMWLPDVTVELRSLAPAEYADITRQIRHHPSVILYSLGCELSQSVDGDLLGKLNAAVSGLVSDVLICDNSGSGESYGGLDFDFSDFSDYHPYYDLHYFEPLLDNWKRDWQTPRPWIFGEFCDSDTFRDLNEIIEANDGAKPWWMTPDNPVTTWRPESQAMLEAQLRLARAQSSFTPQELVKISYAQALVIRKYTLELLHRRVGIGGYILTGLRDTPISTSGFFDDFSRSKWSPEEVLPINNDAVLCLDGDRRRRWQFGGDRPERIDLYNLWSGEKGRWHVILSQTISEIAADCQLNWTLTDGSGNQIAAGNSRVDQAIFPGVPREVGIINCQLPNVQRAVELKLTVNFTGDGLNIDNQWPVWVYPSLLEPSENLGIIDPAHRFDDYGDWLKPVPRIGTTDRLAEYEVILSTTWDANLQNYIKDGGKVLLLQQGNGPLPVNRCPFWREAIKLFPDHPVWEKFPQQGFTDMQFFGLASDVAFNTAQLPKALLEQAQIRSILRRLDAREFLMSEYVFEAQIGQGVLLGCALRLQGGAGAQPYGWQRNAAGSVMLSIFLDYLLEK